MKRIKGEIDLSSWSLGSIDELHKGMEQLLLNATRDVLNIALDGDDSYITFPIEWAGAPGAKYNSDGHGGPVVTDPLTVYLSTGLGGGEGCDPIYAFSLREALQSGISNCAEDGSFSHGLSLLSASLRELADEIDAAVAVGALDRPTSPPAGAGSMSKPHVSLSQKSITVVAEWVCSHEGESISKAWFAASIAMAELQEIEAFDAKLDCLDVWDTTTLVAQMRDRIGRVILKRIKAEQL
jgi:hypothetical protein